MSSDARYTERDLILAKREAFVRGCETVLNSMSPDKTGGAWSLLGMQLAYVISEFKKGLSLTAEKAFPADLSKTKLTSPMRAPDALDPRAGGHT